MTPLVGVDENSSVMPRHSSDNVDEEDLVRDTA